MSGDPLDSLDVPVARVGGGRHTRRSRAAVVAAGVVVASWLGVTVLGRQAQDEPAAAQASLPTSAAIATPPAATRRPGPDLPTIANIDLPDAPFPVFAVRDGQDAHLLIWHPGSFSVGQMLTYPGAFGGTYTSSPQPGTDTATDGGTLAWLSPDRTALLISRIQSASVEGSDSATLATLGGIAWERDGVTALGGVSWSSDSDRLVLTERHDRWLILERGDGWNAREIDLSAAVPATPSRPSGGDFALTSQVVPAAFSEDRAWIVGAMLGPPGSLWTPALRVRVADGHVEPLSSLPIGGPNGLAHVPSLIADPATGRTVGYGPNGNIPGGPPQLEVREPDGSYAFGVRTGIVISWLWTGDGRIVVLGADGYPFPSRWTLQIVDRDGKPRTLLEAPRASGGAMFGIRNGYAGLILTGANPTRRQIIVVRLADGATSAITMDRFGADGPLAAGWLQ